MFHSIRRFFWELNGVKKYQAALAIERKSDKSFARSGCAVKSKISMVAVDLQPRRAERMRFSREKQLRVEGWQGQHTHLAHDYVLQRRTMKGIISRDKPSYALVSPTKCSDTDE